MAHGLFAGLPYALGISGGFASPLAAELLPQADVVVAFGATLNHWTTRHGALLAPDARLVQVDVEPDAIGAHRRWTSAIVGDAGETPEASTPSSPRRGTPQAGRRTPEVAAAIAAAPLARRALRGPAAPTARSIPATLRIALDRLLPEQRTVAVDSGAFLGWPAMYLDVADARRGCSPTPSSPSGSASAARSARPSRGPTA